MKKLVLTFVAALFVMGAPLSADAVSLGSATGSTVDFLNVQESGPGSLYAPTAYTAGDSLILVPMGFLSLSTNGGSDTTTGILTMTLQAHPGFTLSSVTFDEVGDYAFVGRGTEATSASIESVLEGTSGSHSLASNAAISPGSEFLMTFDPSSGNFKSSVTLDMEGLGITSLEITFTSTLRTTSELGTAALIQKKTFVGPVVSVGTRPMPEPSAQLLFAAGILIVCGTLARSKREQG